MGKIIIGKADEFPPGKIQKITADGKDILVANIDGNYFAIDDTCTHAGASLSEGNLKDSAIVCGWHGAEFDVKTGKMTSFPVKIKDLKSYKITLESGNIFLEA